MILHLVSKHDVFTNNIAFQIISLVHDNSIMKLGLAAGVRFEGKNISMIDIETNDVAKKVAFLLNGKLQLDLDSFSMRKENGVLVLKEKASSTSVSRISSFK